VAELFTLVIYFYFSCQGFKLRLLSHSYFFVLILINGSMGIQVGSPLILLLHFLQGEDITQAYDVAVYHHARLLLFVEAAGLLQELGAMVSPTDMVWIVPTEQFPPQVLDPRVISLELAFEA
jgi:hypothetical protein